MRAQPTNHLKQTWRWLYPLRWALALLWLGWGWPLPAMAVEPLAVIVAKGQTFKVASVVDLSLIYWRKKLYWPEGLPMQPVNLATDSAQRRLFSQRVLGSLPETQSDYWNELYYHGTSPPHVVVSQEAMLRYVTDTPGAIGYVEGCKVDARVKVLLWLLPDGSVTNAAPNLNCPAPG